MKLSKKVLLAVSLVIILAFALLIGVMVSNPNPAQEYDDQTKAKLKSYNTELDLLKRLIQESPYNKTLKNLLIDLGPWIDRLSLGN
ncbi:hypothetical protein J4206_05625 [Candidatus Woesearchaeota archaeon]|nr:hypothetical protein [Candidatus Woesearchaeota archaeon]